MFEGEGSKWSKRHEHTLRAFLNRSCQPESNSSSISQKDDVLSKIQCKKLAKRQPEQTQTNPKLFGIWILGFSPYRNLRVLFWAPGPRFWSKMPKGLFNIWTVSCEFIKLDGRPLVQSRWGVRIADDEEHGTRGFVLQGLFHKTTTMSTFAALRAWMALEV